MKLQIISFTFPPNQGIGGRRWAKFAKYLKRNGVGLRIIASKNESPILSEWVRDTKETEDDICFLESDYPKHLGFYDPSLLHKVRYKLGKWKSMYTTKGNYYDKSIHWLESLKAEVRKNYFDGYKKVMVSVAPFHSAIAISELKSELPDMELFVDFRDPWTTNRTAYGFEGLTNRRQDFERRAEQFVIDSADHVVSVSKEMNEHFQSICNSDTAFSVIPNGYDHEDLPPFDSQGSSTMGRFVFAGTLYEKSLHQFNVLVYALDELKNQNSSQYKKLKFDFYGSVPNDTLTHFERHEALNFHGKIPLAQVYREINDSSGCLLFLSDDLNYSFSTKFYEYLALMKPILLFAKPGRTSAFIEQNELGVLLTRKNTKRVFKELAEAGYNLNIQNAQEILKSSSVEALTEDWIKLLKTQI